MNVERQVRAGVVLLVVISLLMLFAVVGIAFVIYAQAQATTARIHRESESLTRPDLDPELLLAYFLGQAVYDTEDVYSALRGHSLARNMYGYNSGAPNTLPYSGMGRMHYPTVLGQDDYNLTNYTYFASDGFLRDPERHGSRVDPQAPPGPYVAGNPSYTYPDANSLFLAAVQGKDGRVLTPSYHRPWLFNPTTSLNDPANPNWSNAEGKYRILRPRPAEHSPSFPYPEDGGGDVKNLTDSPGYLDPITGQYCNNDSIWIDLGFPVMTGSDGRKFKPLFAPLIQDLDNRVNVNAHGYWFCHPWLGGLNVTRFQSDKGWGPWEVNPRWVISAPNEARNLYLGGNGIPGRYDVTGNYWGSGWWRLADRYGPGGPFYSTTNYDCFGDYKNDYFQLPGSFGWPATTCFPAITDIAGNGGGHWTELYSHPRNYNLFSPTQNSWSNAGQVAQRDRTFNLCNLEALLRYGDRGSPALSSDLFALCPQSFANASTRRQVTTHSFDLLRPGVTPWAWSGQGSNALQLTTGQPFPTGGPLRPPPLPTAPTTGEFGPSWQSTSAARGRIDLNRAWTISPATLETQPAYPPIDPNTFRITDMARFQAAQEGRQQMAREIFECLWRVTGAEDPAQAVPNSPEFDALRWLAQLAVNIVDYVDNDDYITPFNWTTNEWVFGTELPRLVLNEAYAEIANDPGDPKTGNRATMDYKLSFWLELHNPLDGRTNNPGGGTTVVRLSEDAKARLQVPASGADAAYSVYQIAIAKTPNPELKNAGNSRGEPAAANLVLTVSDYSPEPAPAQQPILGSNEYIVVRPVALSTSGAAGRNDGFSLLGPKDNPQGASDWPQVTLRVKDTPGAQTSTGVRSSLVYEVSKDDLPNRPVANHSLLLRRLACPHVPPQPDPAKPNYNPYVTVDYVEELKTTDAVSVDSQGNHVGGITNVTDRFSVGRNQPYAALRNHQRDQKPNPPLQNQPQHSFYKINEQAANPFVWLTFMDRPLASPIELLHVSGFKPHELTQQFVGVDQNMNPKKYGHYAPWQNPQARIYRLLEFLEAGTRLQWTPMDGRVPGRININTIWDEETFLALCDPQNVNNRFSVDEAKAVYQRMRQARTPGGSPGQNDRPFRGYAAPLAAPGDSQYPLGCGINDTLLRANPANPSKLLFENDPGPGHDHPFFRYDLVTKIGNQATSRSNVFAIWLTVGFFEVLDDGFGSAGPLNRPPRLGAEIGRLEGRHVRHRMFAVIDRTNLTIDPARPGQQGPRPFFIDAETAVPAPGEARITVPALQGRYEELAWKIEVGSQLVVDAGPNQETVQVTAIDPGVPPAFTARFAKKHAAGFAVSNATLGNPGPQTRFDPRHPAYSGVVRYFSVIE